MIMEILITGKLHDEAITALGRISAASVVYRPDCPVSELPELVRTCNVLVTRSETEINKELIDQAPHLKVVGRAAVGVANIDLEYATEKGILVVNCPGKNTNSAAELTFALILSIVRHVHHAYNHLRQGGWDRHRFRGRELRRKKIGIIGLGNVGHRVCKFAHGFDMDVYGYDIYLPLERFSRYNVKKTENIRELARICDILTVHVPLNRETSGMIDRTVMQELGPQGILINAARGDVVCKEDLLLALQKNEIGAVGIDTWHNEPHPDPELYQHPKVFGTPHIGASTAEAQRAIGMTIVAQIKKAIAGGVIDYPVNVPYSTVIDSPLQRSFAVLAEKLGSLMGQIVAVNPKFVKIKYSKELGQCSLIKLSWMKGFFHHVVDGFVSIVNCERYRRNMGITIEEEVSDFVPKSELEIILTDGKNKSTVVGGIVYDENKFRILHIEDFHFEIDPTGLFLLIRNRDLPGVVGDIGGFLAAEGVNIGSIFLSRKKREGTAMAMIEIDAELQQDARKRLLQIRNILSLNQISL